MLERTIVTYHGGAQGAQYHCTVKGGLVTPPLNLAQLGFDVQLRRSMAVSPFIHVVHSGATLTEQVRFAKAGLL